MTQIIELTQEEAEKESFQTGLIDGSYFAGVFKAIKDKTGIGEDNATTILVNIIAHKGLEMEKVPEKTPAIGFVANNQEEYEDYMEEEE